VRQPVLGRAGRDLAHRKPNRLRLDPIWRSPAQARWRLVAAPPLHHPIMRAQKRIRSHAPANRREAVEVTPSPVSERSRREANPTKQPMLTILVGANCVNECLMDKKHFSPVM
jgi:hypothetical protein